MWYDGLVHATWWQVVVYVLIATHITIVSVTVYLHRHSAHRALDLHPAPAHFFRFWLWLTTGMTTREWTAIHRKHHTVTDVEGDPHSPVVYGLTAVLLTGSELYRTAGRDRAMIERFGAGTPDDWIERNIYTKYSRSGVTLMAITNLLLFGPIGITAWAVQMMWIPLFAAGVINGLGHRFGYRNFECPDAATNVVPWGILIGGEELHNNHHTYPNSAKLSVKWYECDLGWGYIRLFEMLGLAKVRSSGPMVERVLGKNAIDMDTVWGVLNDRFRVMARFAEEVVSPLVDQECARLDAAARRILQRTKPVLCRTEMLVNARDRENLSEAMTNSAVVKTLYELRLQLQAVWAKRSGNKEELLEAFRSWCSCAEETGIQALREFVEDLRSYSLPATAKA